MELREELERLIKRYERYCKEDIEKASKYEAEGNTAMNYYMEGRSDAKSRVIDDLKIALELESND